MTPDAPVGEVERLAGLLAEHPHVNKSAGWNGSPNPGDWRNIRPCCSGCNERLPDTSEATFRTHLATVLAEHTQRAEVGLRERVTALLDNDWINLANSTDRYLATNYGLVVTVDDVRDALAAGEER